MIPVSAKKHSSEGDAWEDQPSEHQIRGLRVVSAADHRAEAPQKQCFSDTGIYDSAGPRLLAPGCGLSAAGCFCLLSAVS